MQTNMDFICPLCGKRDLFPSIVKLEANYGSVYDGERVTVNVCGLCIDSMVERMKQLNIPYEENTLK